MHTSLVLVALMGPGAAPAVMVPEAPSWQSSYGAARAAGREQGKPLAIFLGSGPAGWRELTVEGGLTRRARQLLAESYVCVYVDNSSSKERVLAEAFEVGSGTGLAISSVNGEAQAFWHRGTMSQSELEETLQKFTSVASVRRTESLSRARYSTLSYPDSSMRPTTESVATTTTSLANASPTYSPVTYGSYSTANYATPVSYGSPLNYGSQVSYGSSPSLATPAAYSAPMMAAPSYSGYSGGYAGGQTSGSC